MSKIIASDHVTKHVIEPVLPIDSTPSEEISKEGQKQTKAYYCCLATIVSGILVGISGIIYFIFKAVEWHPNYGIIAYIGASASLFLGGLITFTGAYSLYTLFRDDPTNNT